MDYLDNYNIKTFGPKKKSSQLEGSKIFTKQICEKYNIPTAKFGIFKNINETNKFLKKIENKKRIKERQKNYSFTFRSFGIINSFEYKILENLAVGILYENSSASNENETIKESSVGTAIFALYGFNECYYCDTAAFVGVYGEGNQISTTDQGSEYKYKFQYLYLLSGYQWYWNTDISLALLGGLVYRNKSKVSETAVNNEVFSESDVQLTKAGFDFYPAILVGYSF